jgi:toxin ParE1/3/4
MAFKIVIKPIVFSDAEEAVVYYEKKLPGLGRRFYTSFLSALNEIQLKPSTFSYIKKPVRRHLIKKFPYKIFYLTADDSIIVIGVSHAKRSNAFVRKRLRLIE